MQLSDKGKPLVDTACEKKGEKKDSKLGTL